jgi:hypothetical protein
MYAMLPSQAVWVFDFIWSLVIPELADPWVPARNEQSNWWGQQNQA